MPVDVTLLKKFSPSLCYVPYFISTASLLDSFAGISIRLGFSAMVSLHYVNNWDKT